MSQSETPCRTPLSLYALGTQSDWVFNGGAWGKPGQQRIVDLTKQAGIDRLYWRTHNGGQACYPSEVCTVMDGSIYRDPDFSGVGVLPKSFFAYATHIDYSKWDQVADMSEIATESGLEYCHWYTVFEDDHGGHLKSDFLRDHAEFRCTDRSGKQASGFLDFWYPEVREYKLKIVKEILERPCRRLLLDFVRRNGTPSADGDGNFAYGFNAEIVEGFRGETGLDARELHPGDAEWDAWLHYNARPLTDFLRSVHAMASDAGVAVDVMVWPVKCLDWKALDLQAITGQGLVESVLVGSQRYACSAAEAVRQVAVVRAQVGGSATVVPGLPGYHGLSPALVDRFIEGALEAGCNAVALHESNHVLESPISDGLRAWSFGVPNSLREVTATREVSLPVGYSGFLKCFSVDTLGSDQNTYLSVAWDESKLTVSVECSERNPEKLKPVPGLSKANYNARQLRARGFWNPFESVHVFLDAAHSHDEYFHFILDPEGDAMCETRSDEDWAGEWEHEVEITDDQWKAVFRIPWTTIKTTPGTGKLFGFQVVRVQNSPRETSSWFCSYGRRMNPAEFGHLRLA